MLIVLAWLAMASGAHADNQYKLLVLAMPGKYHYEYIPIARDSLETLAKLHAFELTYTNKPEVFDGDLSQYAAMMFLNTPGEELNEPRRKKFEDYMRNGGNAMLVHRALIIPPNTWPWFEKLIGRRVGNHPMLQTGVAEVVDKKFPATYGLPSRWVWSDEWYVFDNPYNIKHPSGAECRRKHLRPDQDLAGPGVAWHGQGSPGGVVSPRREGPRVHHLAGTQRRNVPRPAIPVAPDGRHLLDRDRQGYPAVSAYS
jgi:hypothetical protein